jgi:hypothetical protein
MNTRRTSNTIKLLCLLLLALIPSVLSAQSENRHTITGKITDAETGNILDKAIVYLANTSFGNSSGKDGTFKISYIPKGEFQLIVSRVGYERKNIPVNTEYSDSLYFDIKLQPRPVKTNEVEVLADRPEELKV